jgi:hypothetical protein
MEVVRAAISFRQRGFRELAEGEAVTGVRAIG